MLLLRWVLLPDGPWSFYDLEDDPQEQSDEDWLSFQFEDDFIQVWLDDEDQKDETDDEWIYRLDDDSTELVEEFIEVILSDEDLKDESDEDWVINRSLDEVYDTDQIVYIIDHEEQIDDDDAWFDPYGHIDLPPPDVSEQIWFVSEQDEYYSPDPEDDALFDPRGVTDRTCVVCGLNDFIYYITEDRLAFYVSEDCQSCYVASPIISSGRQIEEWEVEEEEFEFLKKKVAEHYRFADSSNIETVYYDKNTKQMQIKFRKGATYKFDGVNPSKMKGMIKAKSAGSYFHNKIKPKHPGKKM